MGLGVKQMLCFFGTNNNINKISCNICPCKESAKFHVWVSHVFSPPGSLTLE